MKKNKGFTLIELLVVIAIIGLLSTIVLVSLNSARNKAKDARIEADVSQVRTTAELYSSNNSNSYTGLAAYGDITTLMNDIITQNPTAAQSVNVTTDGTAYAAGANLNGGGYICVDSTGNSKTYTTGSWSTTPTVCP